MSSLNTPSSPEKPSPGYETRDVNSRAVGAFALGLSLVVALLFPLIRWMFSQLEADALNRDAGQPHAADQRPPAPRLQVHPVTDLDELRRHEDERLRSYGWIDREKKVARIPIERAMSILAERGFPVPDSPEESSTIEGAPK